MKPCGESDGIGNVERGIVIDLRSSIIVHGDGAAKDAPRTSGGSSEGEMVVADGVVGLVA